MADRTIPLGCRALVSGGRLELEGCGRCIPWNGMLVMSAHRAECPSTEVEHLDLVVFYNRIRRRRGGPPTAKHFDLVSADTLHGHCRSTKKCCTEKCWWQHIGQPRTEPRTAPQHPRQQANSPDFLRFRLQHRGTDTSHISPAIICKWGKLC